MSNLLQTDSGRNAIRRVCCWLAHRRMSRQFRRSFYREFYRVFNTSGASFDFSRVIDGFNPANDVEISNLNALLGQTGCLNESIANTDIYVDSVNGSDVTGNGSQITPWASLWFLSNLPQKIKHRYRIILLSDIVTDDISINVNFDDNGSLAIVGSSAPATVVTSMVSSAIGSADGTSTVMRSVQVAAPTWTDDQHWSHFIKWLDGAAIGRSAPIHMNFSDEIYSLKLENAGIAPGDSFTIIRPQYTINCKSFVINATGPYYKVDTDYGSRVLIGNVNIDLSGTNELKNIFSLNGNIGYCVSFVRAKIAANLEEPIEITCKSLNMQRFFDATIDNIALTGITNFVDTDNVCGFSIYKTSPNGTDDELVSRGAYEGINAVDIRGRWNLRGDSYLHYCTCGTLIQIAGDNNIDHVHLDGYPNFSAFEMEKGSVFMNFPHFSGRFTTPGSATNCIKFILGLLRMYSPTGPAVSLFSNVGCDFIGSGNIQINTAATAVTGTAGDIDFKISGISAWPATVDTSVNDGNGNWAIWV